MINDDKASAEDGKSYPEGYRSLIVDQEPHPTKPDHEKISSCAITHNDQSEKIQVTSKVNNYKDLRASTIIKVGIHKSKATILGKNITNII